MDAFALTAEQEALRLEVRAWLKEHMPRDWAHQMLGRSDVPRPEAYELMRGWQRQLAEELGFVMDGEGRLRDAGGTQPVAPITEGTGRTATAVLSVVDYWGRIGVRADLFSPPVGTTSAQATAERPGFQLLSATLSWSEMRHLARFRGGSNIPTAQNNYRGSNISRYDNAELTGLVDRFFRLAVIPESAFFFLVVGLTIQHSATSASALPARGAGSTEIEPPSSQVIAESPSAESASTEPASAESWKLRAV